MAWRSIWGETRDHARRIQERLSQLEQGHNPLQVLLGFTEGLIGQALALGKTPLDLLRGFSGEEKVLKNAKDACATEALEIATYSALELGDARTAKLAASIRRDEERMLVRILREIPKLTDAVVDEEIEGRPSYELAKTGTADATREAAREVKQTARATQARAKRTARQARKVPGVAQAEGQMKGAVAFEEDLAIARYDSLTAEEILSKLPELSQIDLAKVDSYERKNDNRTTILSRITALRGQEPWPGYDELTVAEIESVLGEGDEQRPEGCRRLRAHPQEPGRRAPQHVARDRQRLTASPTRTERNELRPRPRGGPHRERSDISIGAVSRSLD